MGDSLLLHICCGPCAIGTIPHWRQAGWQVSGYFFNPNIQPLLEFSRRLEGVRELRSHLTISVQENLLYDPLEWFARAGSQAERCRACVGWRLDETAAHAARGGFGAFTTSLAISPWQDHDAIKETGTAAASRHGVDFLYEDLTSLYRESRRLARNAGLYRQQYCGCVLSEWERYRDQA